jgi:hypothetical protein
MYNLKLLGASGVTDHLSVTGATFLAGTVSCLYTDQDERVVAGAPVSQIPLLWRGLAETVGLVVDNSGRIIDGPRAHVPGL